MTLSTMTGDCISQKTWYFHKQLSIKAEFGIWGNEPAGCLGTEATVEDRMMLTSVV